jgi:hypothetical protein
LKLGVLDLGLGAGQPDILWFFSLQVNEYLENNPAVFLYIKHEM